jgi:tRNA(Ile)-lysidine synthase
MNLLEIFKKRISSLNLPVAGKPILLAVSGGLDSIVMLHLCHKAGISCAVAHCNFQLRGRESDDDAEFVRHLCREYALKLYLKKFNTESYALKHSVSIQMAAREMRYTWFEHLSKQHNFTSIFTAHQQDDTIESFFINLIRGTGIAGLTGIPEQNKKIVRPLLEFSRKNLKAYALKEKLQWREDSSNENEEYLRNRVRKQLIPLLKKLQPGFETVMMRNITNIRESVRLEEEFAGILKQKYVRTTGKDKLIIDLKKLRREKEAAVKLGLLLRYLGFKSHDPVAILRITNPGKVYISGKKRLLKDRDVLILEEQETKPLGSFILSGNEQEVVGDRITLHAVRVEYTGKSDISTDRDIHQLDAAKLRFPLKVRHWKYGDFFYPLGMKQRKKISDFLVDKKIDRFEKENCLVVLSGKDIVCILGHRIDDRFKITSQTTEIFTVTLKKYE